MEVWDWDAGSDDQKIARATIPLAPLAKEEDKSEAWYEFLQDGQLVWGLDGSKAIVRVRLERNVDLSDVGLNIGQFIPDPDELKSLDCSKKPWESATRGLMFDIENCSEYPVVITGMEARQPPRCY